MAKRDITAKKIAKLRKLMRQTPQGSIDLVTWLKDRRYAQTSGDAKRLLIDGKVFKGKTAIGRNRAFVQGPDPTKEPTLQWTAAPMVPASWRKKITVDA